MYIHGVCMRNHIIYEVYVRYYLISSVDDHDDRYKYHHHIFVVETSARDDACMCDDDGRRAAALPQQNTDHEISPSALQNARRAGGNPTVQYVVTVATCDIPLPGGDTEVLGRIKRERGVLASRTKAMTFCGCMYENSARNVNADRK
uniref:Uncharacterized protein n=1 Tax=Schizaphis graminum TaxID=13262 RepID=A0A2S2NKI9_SCHGA